MKQKTLYVLWGGMFILCAALGFIPEPTGLLKWLMTALSVAFFVPGGLLLYRAIQEKDRQTVLLIRNLAALSLALTLILLVLNILSVLWTEFLGDALYVILVIVSSPMVCGGSYALSMFLWACLLIVSLKNAKK